MLYPILRPGWLYHVIPHLKTGGVILCYNHFRTGGLYHVIPHVKTGEVIPCLYHI